MATVNFPTTRLNSDNSDWTDNDPLETGDQITRNTIVFEWNGSAWIKLTVFDPDRIPDLSANKITSDELDSDRIPNLSGNKIQNRSIDIVKLSNGTTGKYIGFNSSGNAAELDVIDSLTITTETVKVLSAGTSVEISAANMTSGANANVAHGLGSSPDYIDFYYECVTANNNWVVGDRIPVKEASRSTVGANSTHVYISLPAGGAQVIVADRDGGDQKIITLSQWKAVAIPYIFEDKTVVTGIS